MDVRSERRIVTALFIDVVGSTDLMVRLGPEVMRRRLADAFAHMSARITEHGGTVESYAGDAVYAIFGAPTARVDDPERALRAGRACAEWAAGGLGDDRLAVRIGIETGEALVDLDAVARHERMAIGPCVNIAARLQQHADPGEILIGPAAHAATAGVARAEPVGRLDLKGLGPMDAWRLIDFEAAVDAAPLVPFVGRRHEFEILTDAADRAGKGEQILALVTGAPGLGKSRLVDELLSSRRAHDQARTIVVRCRPAGEEGTDTPLRQLIEAEATGATPESLRALLREVLEPNVAAVAATAILHSTGLESSAELQAINRYEQRVNIAEAWRQYLTAIARRQPLILAVEDVHWADPVTVFMLYHVTASGDAPLLVVATARPEFAGSPLIRPGESLVQVDLAPLDAAAAEELAEAAGGALAGLDRAAGNPLFIIELARAHSGETARDQLPPTIQAAIAARLDELAPDERHLLQHVSVAGESFDVRDAALLADRDPAEIAGLLGRIAHLGFVESSDRGYRFYHALAHDVAYGRLPVSTCRELHARYADEGVAPSDALARAYHLWQAVKPPDAEWVWEDASRLHALRREAFSAQLAAGQQLESRNQYEQAEQVYARALELAADDAERAAARVDLARAQHRQGKGDDAWRNRLAAIAAYEAAGSSAPAAVYAEMLEILAFNWGYFESLPTDAEVRRLLDTGLREARSAGDDAALAKLLVVDASVRGDATGTDEVGTFLESDDPLRFADAGHRLAQVLMWNGELARSLELYGRVFDDLLPRGALINEPEARIWYALASFFAGDLQLASQLRDRADADLAKGRSVHTQSHVLGIRSLVALGQGDWSQLLHVTEEIEAVLAAHPHDGFCLVGGSAVGFGGAARLRAGLPVPNDLAADAARMIDESELVQASSIMLAKAMAGDERAVEHGAQAYASGLRLVDRASVWDVIHLQPAITAVMLERWDMLDEPVARMGHCAARGSRLAAAALDAVREEREGNPRHDQLRALGYNGISELFRIRARTAEVARA